MLQQTTAQATTAAPSQPTEKRWFTIAASRTEYTWAEDGSLKEPEHFDLHKFSVELETGGLFGIGLLARIEQAVQDYYPGGKLQDYWPIRNPPAAALEF